MCMCGFAKVIHTHTHIHDQHVNTHLFTLPTSHLIYIYIYTYWLLVFNFFYFFYLFINLLISHKNWFAPKNENSQNSPELIYDLKSAQSSQKWDVDKISGYPDPQKTYPHLKWVQIHVKKINKQSRKPLWYRCLLDDMALIPLWTPSFTTRKF